VGIRFSITKLLSFSERASSFKEKMRRSTCKRLSNAYVSKRAKICNVLQVLW